MSVNVVICFMPVNISNTDYLHLCAFKMRMVTLPLTLINRPIMGDLNVQRCK